MVGGYAEMYSFAAMIQKIERRSDYGRNSWTIEWYVASVGSVFTADNFPAVAERSRGPLSEGSVVLNVSSRAKKSSLAVITSNHLQRCQHIVVRYVSCHMTTTVDMKQAICVSAKVATHKLS